MPAATRDLHVVGIDVGTTNTKAVLVSVRPAAASSAVTSTPGSVRCVDRVVAATPYDADTLVGCVLGLLRRLLQGGAPPPAAVGIASMAETGVALDAQDRPLTPLLSWDTDRGTDDADTVAREHGAEALFAATGVRVSPKVPLVTWTALRRTSTDTWARMRRWAGVADLVCLALTGRLATDHTLAGRTMAYRLPGTDEPPAESFDAALLGIAGLEPDQLPDVCPPSSEAGRTLATAADRSGLPAGVPVVVAGHDHQVGAHAAGARQPGASADSVGTAEAVLRVVGARPDPARVRRAGMSLVRTVGGRYDAVLAGASSAGSLLATWLHQQGLSGCADDLLERARTPPEDPTGILVLPYLRGRQCPEPDPWATFRMVGTRTGDSPERLLRALFEGLCLQTRWMLTEQRRLVSASEGADGPVTLLGSHAATAGLWREVKERVLPAGLRVVDEAEPVAAGAALVAAERSGLVEPGVLSLPAAEARSGRPDLYQEAFHRFVGHARARPAATASDTDPVLRGDP